MMRKNVIALVMVVFAVVVVNVMLALDAVSYTHLTLPTT